ncbi:MAG: hypothetical protein LBM04_13905 [Opitutaceae bacterium]|nr:hypothetical protein [Opitutaceae bacterium]
MSRTTAIAAAATVAAATIATVTAATVTASLAPPSRKIYATHATQPRTPPTHRK